MNFETIKRMFGWCIPLLLSPFLSDAQSTLNDQKLTINQIWMMADSNNKKNQIQQLQVEASDAHVKVSKAERLPELAAEGTLAHVFPLPIYENGLFHTPAQFPVVSKYYKVGADAYLNLYNGGKTNTEIAASKTESALSSLKKGQQQQEMFLFSERWNGNINRKTKEYDFLNTLKNILPIVSQHPLPIALPTTENERLRPVLRHIVENLSNDMMSLESVGKATSFSTRTLSRLFQSALNVSFFQYLKLARMIKAMEKLLESEATISEIAYSVGYNSISSFSNTFFKMVGKRPSEFKELKQSSLTSLNLV